MSNYYEQFLQKMEFYKTCTHPDMYEWYISNMHYIIRDYKSYKPPMIYKYMLTFTLDPKKGPHDLDKMEQYIVGLLTNKENEKIYYVCEHRLTNCHWHAVIYRKSVFKHDSIRYYKQKFGHVDVSRSHDLSDEHTQKYLSKELDSKIIHLK